ncbi:DHA2 family efflux MFS transporter permease subunit [Aneurinibacillus terranovensis]|uniref:DHA2 family efflux MFS transporter permease subunit n=1 Tax=Aneurinibacillus terranovensis TaxID=278991 RepID=UPI00040AC0C5|nr:DHA2 family efflux MFS transporter permease subunit [Aneurinibacillus terranovensis]
MSIYLFIYIVIALLIIVGVNRFLIRKHEAHTKHRIEPTLTGSISGFNTEDVITPEVIKYTKDDVDREELRMGPLMAVLILGMFIAILNQTLINVAMPHIMNDFNESANTIQWLVTSYMLVNGVLIPISAYLMERFGTRKLYLASMILFTIGSLICGIAPNFSVMLIGRIIQAMGAGVLMPLVMNVFLTVFPPEKRGAALGTVGIAMFFAPAVGPTLSGWVVQNYTWRILFYGMIPIAIVDILLAVVLLKEIMKPTLPKFDLTSFIFSTLGFGGLLYGFSEAGNNGWSSAKVVIALIIGGVFLVLFIWRQLISDEPILEFRVFKYNIFTLTTIVSSTINMALFGGMLLLPIYLQNIRGFTPLESGLLLLPGAIIMGVMSPISGAIFDRIGIRPLAVVGLTITAITTYQFSKLSMDTPYSHILTLYTVRSAGMSLLMMTIMTAGLNQLPRYLTSHGNAMSNTMRQVAGSIGTAFLVTVMSTRSTVHLGDYANNASTANPYFVERLNEIGRGLASLAGLPARAGQPLATQVIYGMAQQQSTISGINDAFIIATGITVVALVFSFFINRVVP